MSDLARRAALLTACGLVLAGAAMAKCFGRENSTLGPVLVTDFDHSPSLPDPGLLTTCFRDLGNNPCAFPTVTIDFSACGSDVEIAEGQERTDVIVNCAARTITIFAGPTGCINLGPFLARTGIHVPGWSTVPGMNPSRNIGPASAVGPCAVIYVDGFLMGTVPVRVVRYDLEGDGDVDAGDRAFTLDAMGHFFSEPVAAYRTFHDYDHDGDVDAGDASAAMDAEALYFSGARTPYAGVFCP